VDEKQKRYAKWGITAILAGLLGVFVLPIAVTIAWNLVSLAAAGVILLALWFLLPAVAEGLATLGYKAKELVWKSDPIAKLWRDLFDFGKEIEELNTNIEEVATEEFEFDSELKANRDILGPERMLDWNERLSEIRESKNFLIEQREELRVVYKESERDVRINEVEWKLGKAYNKAANAVNKANGIASGTQGGKVAMATIQHNLSQGRARLQTLRTAKSSAEIREIMKQRANPNTIDTTAKVVPEPKALSNSPSPVLNGLTVGGKNPTAARLAPADAKVQSLIDRI
jgi:hypothetical protein